MNNNQHENDDDDDDDNNISLIRYYWECYLHRRFRDPRLHKKLLEKEVLSFAEDVLFCMRFVARGIFNFVKNLPSSLRSFFEPLTHLAKVYDYGEEYSKREQLEYNEMTSNFGEFWSRFGGLHYWAIRRNFTAIIAGCWLLFFLLLGIVLALYFQVRWLERHAREKNEQPIQHRSPF